VNVKCDLLDQGRKDERVGTSGIAKDKAEEELGEWEEEDRASLLTSGPKTERNDVELKEIVMMMREEKELSDN
jgi:hypothetical protein